MRPSGNPLPNKPVVTAAGAAFHRFSAQIRADHPEPVERPHPRAIQLAIKVCEIDARGHGVSIRELMEDGFSATELFEHHATANAILRGGPGL